MFFAGLFISKPRSVTAPVTEFTGNGVNTIGLNMSAGSGNNFTGSSSTIPLTFAPDLGNDFTGSSSTIPMLVSPGKGYNFAGNNVEIPFSILAQN